MRITNNGNASMPGSRDSSIKKGKLATTVPKTVSEKEDKVPVKKEESKEVS